MKTLIVFAALLVSVQSSASDIARFVAPDHNQANCAANPAELAARPTVAAALQTFGGLDSVIGTWELSGIPFKSDIISFSADRNGFYVQNSDDIPAKASICSQLNTDRQLMLRIAVHKPACPETRNIFVRSKGVGKMRVTAYATRAIGSVTFKRIAPTPQPAGATKGRVKQCAS
jgi:hypothetical protein